MNSEFEGPRIEYFISKGVSGKRLFKWDKLKQTVLQVIVTPGKVKKGRANARGIYQISESTLKANYLTSLGKKESKYNYVMPTTGKMFDYFRKIVVQQILDF